MAARGRVLSMRALMFILVVLLLLPAVPAQATAPAATYVAWLKGDGTSGVEAVSPGSAALARSDASAECSGMAPLQNSCALQLPITCNACFGALVYFSSVLSMPPDVEMSHHIVLTTDGGMRATWDISLLLIGTNPPPPLPPFFISSFRFQDLGSRAPHTLTATDHIGVWDPMVIVPGGVVPSLNTVEAGIGPWHIAVYT